MDYNSETLSAAWTEGPQLPSSRPVHWLTFDPLRGKFICRKLDKEWSSLVGVIVRFLPIRVPPDRNGNIACASEDRITASRGRRGRLCADCSDYHTRCTVRWRIWLEEPEQGVLYAMNLSPADSVSFARYAGELETQGYLPGEVLTEMFVAHYGCRRCSLTYNHIVFERREK